jgi:hypothetical protein
MVSATDGLCWGFHNIQYWRHGLSRLYDSGFFLGGSRFLIPCISRAQIFEGKFLSEEYSLYMCKYSICSNYLTHLFFEQIVIKRNTG